MKSPQRHLLPLLSLAVIALASCSQQTHSDSSATDLPPGQAGGVFENTFTERATVTALSRRSRKLTLTSRDGSTVTFPAGPQIRNLDQIHVGDRVSATVTERLVVTVQPNRDAPVTLAKNAKLGTMTNQTYEIVARIQTVQTYERTTTLLFPDGQRRTFQIRPDVDLTRFHPGDTVIIRVTPSLTLLVPEIL